MDIDSWRVRACAGEREQAGTGQWGNEETYVILSTAKNLNYNTHK